MTLTWYQFTGCPGRLASCCAPGFGAGRETHLQKLVDAGIKTVFNLTTDEDQLEWFDTPASQLSSLYAAHGVEEVRYPFLDMTAPSPELAERIVDDLETRLLAGEYVTVHCIAGRGRTGTIVACLLVRQGLTSGEAIDVVRHRVTGSIITPDQERAVHNFARSTKPGRLYSRE